MTDDNTTSKIKADLSIALLQMSEMFEPMLDHAKGVRLKLEQDGWSPTAAETIALQQLQYLMNQAFTGGKG